MVTMEAPTGLSQRSIYDARYRAGGYDHRSKVRVLRAEAKTLHAAVTRALRTNPDASEVSLFDFGYGTGRVTNEFLLSYHKAFGGFRKNLKVLAYDVSLVGLSRAADRLRAAHGFSFERDFEWQPDAENGYIAGSAHRQSGDLTVTVRFIHGSENNPPSEMRTLIEKANDGTQTLVTTSWYSGLAHVSTWADRDRYIRELGNLTQDTGEVILAVPATGDLRDGRQDVDTIHRQVLQYLLVSPQDALYETEIGQTNYCHLFGLDFNRHMQSITKERQRWWMQAIRFPDDEFMSPKAERRNYREVQRMNVKKRRRLWSADDFERCHTVAGIRSGTSWCR